MLSASVTRCRSQVVRQGSAKPPYVGAIPTGTSNVRMGTKVPLRNPSFKVSLQASKARLREGYSYGGGRFRCFGD